MLRTHLARFLKRASRTLDAAASLVEGATIPPPPPLPRVEVERDSGEYGADLSEAAKEMAAACGYPAGRVDGSTAVPLSPLLAGSLRQRRASMRGGR